MRVRNEKMAIYRILNKVNGKGYVGSAARLSTRWSFHRKTLEAGSHHSIHLQHAWDKYGKDQFSFEIIELITDKIQLKIREQYWIDFYDAANPEKGYNICEKADSPLGRKASVETRKLMSLLHKGKKLNLTEEERKRRSERAKELNAKRKGKPGIPHTEETKLLLSQQRLGKKRGSEPQTIIYKQEIREFIKCKGYKPSHISKDPSEKRLGVALSNYLNRLHKSYDSSLVIEFSNIPSWREFHKQELTQFLWDFLNAKSYLPSECSSDNMERKVAQDLRCFLNPLIKGYDPVLAQKIKSLPTKMQYKQLQKLEPTRI